MSIGATMTDMFSAYSFLVDGFSCNSVLQVLIAVLPAWLFGALVGYMLPRPKWLSSKHKAGALVLSSPPGAGFRRLALLYHFAVICREVWCQFTARGTFRGIVRRFWQAVSGQQLAEPTTATASATAELAPHHYDSWYVTEKDLAFFQYRVEQNGEIPGSSDWDLMLDKHINKQLKYQAWRRTLPDGKTEYKSVTVSYDATPEEIIDIYFDDDFRPQWDTMVKEHEVLEHGDFSQRQQVVRWLRKFPFHFLSAREYVIGRRRFQQGDTLYGISKVIDHPRSPVASNHVSMDVFWSMWSCRTVACPWGSDRPACETTLLHHEQFKIPENLARFAVRHGMWSFVRCMAEHVPKFVEQRRQRCGHSEQDPQAYGAGCTPNPPTLAGASIRGSTASLVSMGSSAFGGSECSDTSADGSQCSGTSSTSSKKLARVAAVLFAGGVALMLNGGRSKRPRHPKAHHRRVHKFNPAH